MGILLEIKTQHRFLERNKLGNLDVIVYIYSNVDLKFKNTVFDQPNNYDALRNLMASSFSKILSELRSKRDAEKINVFVENNVIPPNIIVDAMRVCLQQFREYFLQGRKFKLHLL